MKNTKYVLLSALLLLTLMGATKCQMNGAKNDDTNVNVDMDDDSMMDDDMDDDDSMMDDDMDDDDSMMDDDMDDDDSMMDDDDSMMDDDMGEMETMTAAGTYTAYDPALLANANEGNVVLFFHADWCPDCRAAEADIIAHANDIPSDVTILKVDYDTATELKTKYGVTSQHTFVEVDAEGNEVDQWSGSYTLEDLLDNL